MDRFELPDHFARGIFSSPAYLPGALDGLPTSSSRFGRKSSHWEEKEIASLIVI